MESGVGARFGGLIGNIGHSCPSRPHPPLTRSPFSYKEKALTPLRVGSVLPDYGRVLSFTSAGGAKPIAGRGGLEGFTPPHF